MATKKDWINKKVQETLGSQASSPDKKEQKARKKPAKRKAEADWEQRGRRPEERRRRVVAEEEGEENQPVPNSAIAEGEVAEEPAEIEDAAGETEAAEDSPAVLRMHQSFLQIARDLERAAGSSKPAWFCVWEKKMDREKKEREKERNGRRVREKKERNARRKKKEQEERKEEKWKTTDG